MLQQLTSRRLAVVALAVLPLAAALAPLVRKFSVPAARELVFPHALFGVVGIQTREHA